MVASNVGDGYGLELGVQLRQGRKASEGLGEVGTGWVNFRHRTGSGSIPAMPPPALVVCDRVNGRLQWFTLDGKAISPLRRRKLSSLPAHAKTRWRCPPRALTHAPSAFSTKTTPIGPLWVTIRMAQESARRLQDSVSTEGMAGRQVYPPARRRVRQATATSSWSSGVHRPRDVLEESGVRIGDRPRLSGRGLLFGPLIRGRSPVFALTERHHLERMNG